MAKTIEFDEESEESVEETLLFNELLAESIKQTKLLIKETRLLRSSITDNSETISTLEGVLTGAVDAFNDAAEDAVNSVKEVWGIDVKKDSEE